MNRKPDFKAKLVYRTTEEGGRKGFANSGYRPHVEFDNIPNFLSSGQQIFLDKEIVFPGETVTAEITLASYFGYIRNLNVNDTFKFCEGARIIGKGKITEIINNNLENEYSQEEKENLAKRIDNAIEFARNGNTLSVQNKNIKFDHENELVITGFSRNKDFSSITKENALIEVKQLENDYAHWLGLSSKFKEIKNWTRPKYVLSYLDGKNGIGICEVKENQVKWLIG